MSRPVGIFLVFSSLSSAFTAPSIVIRSGVATGVRSTTLFGLKGGQASRQMELAKKMALAKEQALRKKQVGGNENEAVDNKEMDRVPDEEIKRRNDMKRFEDLLNSESATASSEFNSNSGYLTRTQEDEAATAGCECRGLLLVFLL